MSPLLLVASAACEYLAQSTLIFLPIIHYDAGLLPFKSLNICVDNIFLIVLLTSSLRFWLDVYTDSSTL
jgi:hypothetical protein